MKLKKVERKQLRKLSPPPKLETMNNRIAHLFYFFLHPLNHHFSP